ncbi:hypothetical protein A3Q56_05264 [Intoshia linei]|uniref:Uncharacterized protein n=1 Tax=Intoshia linei TaxID=1819745 RepID=A0A177AYF5_9BILA|nr:hypothetical protein A3Q56_05264 [Intoshia linei]
MSVNRVARRRTTIRFTALSEEMLKEIKKKLPHDCNVTISECEHIFKCTNELDRIKAIQLLKTDIKTKMMIREYLHLDDFQSLTGFRYWKYQIKVDMKKLKNKVYNFKDYLEIWGSSIKTIEGRFGTGVGSYFRFLKSLFFLQIPIFLLYFGVILIPQLLSTPVSYIAGTNKTITDLATTCRMNYTVLIDPNDYVQMGLDFIQGTGWMEKTIVFYGSYSGQNILINNSSHYNMPLAYFCVTIAILLISIFFIVNSAGSDISSQLINRSIQKLKYCEMIITFWDFGLNTKRAAKLRLESFEKNVAVNLYNITLKLKYTLIC